MQFVLIVFMAINFFLDCFAQKLTKCAYIKRDRCCTAKWPANCVPKHCFSYILHNCPDRKGIAFRRLIKVKGEIRRAPRPFLHNDELPACGTMETNYRPCTSNKVANLLFLSCCKLYLPAECYSMCIYETNRQSAKKMLIDMIIYKKCNPKYISTILYCASQNRDNRKCCATRGLNAPYLHVGSRCLRMCDPSGTAIGQMSAQDATCIYNWNVIMYCHHSGIREM